MIRNNQENTVLDIRSLSARYKDVKALNNISLSVRRGEILGLIGPNGAGKTTLIRVVSGILKASAGEVLLNDQNITSFSPAERARVLAVVPQARQLGGAFSVEQAVLLGRTAYLGFLGKPSKLDLEKTFWAMDQTSIMHLADRKLAEISGGEQQRVLLARALAQDAPVLLLDEPTNHLDLRYQASLLSTLKTLVEQENLTVLMAMHDLNQVSSIADRVALLVDGSVYSIGNAEDVLTPDNIKATYHTEVESFKHPRSGKYLILPLM